MKVQRFTIVVEYTIGSDPTIVDVDGKPSTIENNPELYVSGQVAQDNFVITNTEVIERKSEWSVSIELSGPPAVKLLELGRRIEILVGDANAAGSMFGDDKLPIRDMQWYFDTEIDARRLAKQIEDIKMPEVTGIHVEEVEMEN